MAYRRFTEKADMDPAADAFTRTDAAGFTDLEWSVVEIARRDPLSSIEPPGRFARTVAALLGSRRDLPLANPRLEALRRFVVAHNHLGARLTDHEIAHFVGAGFTQAQVRLVLSTPSYR